MTAPNVPSTNDATDDPRLHAVELLISRLLRAGVAGSLALLTLGTIRGLARPGGYGQTGEDVRRLITDSGAFPRTLRWLGEGLASFDGPALIVLGLLLLILTPVLRVVISIVAFAAQRDRVLTIITTIVLVLLIVSFALGRAAG